MNQPDREALARAVDILASAPKASIRLFLLLLNRNVRLADAAPAKRMIVGDWAHRSPSGTNPQNGDGPGNKIYKPGVIK